MSIVGDNIKRFRKIKGMSLADLAKKMGNKVTRQALHRYEKGEVIPNDCMIDEICKALDIRRNQLTEPIGRIKVELGEIMWFKLSKY